MENVGDAENVGKLEALNKKLVVLDFYRGSGWGLMQGNSNFYFKPGISVMFY